MHKTEVKNLKTEVTIDKKHCVNTQIVNSNCILSANNDIKRMRFDVSKTVQIW
jgi:hypothetical protein